MAPFEGQAYYDTARESVRKRFDDWMRGSGDHLHPNNAGHAAMAQAIPLTLFT